MTLPKYKKHLLKEILEEAKKNKLGWIVQEQGENLFPNCQENDDRESYDDWVFSKDIKATLKFVDNLGGTADLVFSDWSWLRYINQYGSHKEIDNISDHTTNTESNTWIDILCNRLQDNYCFD